ncbi:hypothetical protein Pmar_PMAR013722 [Perkinsus marinus ATCC 50983]|uniref:Uncharacterized protein n=1 Tax=Perkinsus marinus (strain ATCC 50983 / TXsc) TaxID=423536 RepID=C5LY43_PERM5|nr:hypothetical protein Pmar_PMAR013722 [Perkinsus marinus ATCC 50983]EEQ98373.1 hypothetical protein Pmar_PMAR013722 [Perkinsus marinus ATCC 50983]|eukprot:XP_002765656.1 hypothetical protein Pmar_PMAR013722 [Perkinsus marinus ATCC 50983]
MAEFSWPSVPPQYPQPNGPSPTTPTMAWGSYQPDTVADVGGLAQPYGASGGSPSFDVRTAQQLQQQQPTTAPVLSPGPHPYYTTGSLIDPSRTPQVSTQLPSTATMGINPLEERWEVALMCIGKCLSAPETELGMPPAVYGPCVQPSGFSPLMGDFVAEPSPRSRKFSAVSATTQLSQSQPQQDPKASPKASSTVPDGSVRQMAPQLEQMQQQLDTMTRHLQSLVQTKAQVPPPQQYPTYASSPRYLPATSQPPQATPRDHRWSSVATLPQQQQQQSPYPATDRPAKTSLLDIEENERKMRALAYQLKRLQKDIHSTRLG